MNNKNEILRNLPKIDEVLQEQCLEFYLNELPRSLVLETIRETIDSTRNQILNSNFNFEYSKLLDEILNKLDEKKEKSIANNKEKMQ